MNKQDSNCSMLRLPEKIENNLRKKQYGIYGHSGVQICSWTKKALTGKGVCYKQRFYGVDCHSCMEMSPVVMWCQQNCTFCWRPMEYMKNINISDFKVDEPEEIITNLIEERRKLISGFKGNDKADLKLFDEALIPTHFAISLSGEPTMYPKLFELVEYLKNLPKTKTIFVVSNGQEPTYFEKLIVEPKYAPTQLYISIDAPNPEIFKKINKSLYEDGWERLNKSLETMSKIKTRRVLRFTQIKGLNDLDSQLEEYKNMIEKSKADIIEVKAYMHIGLSRNRHSDKEMPSMDEVRDFADKLCKSLGTYEVGAEMEESRIVILHRKDSPYSLKIEKYEN